MATKLIDLEAHYAVYKAHHSHTLNALLHTIFISPIQFSIFMLFQLTPSFLDIPILGQLNLAFPLLLAFIATNLILDFKAGFLAAFFWVFCFVSSGSLVSTLGISLSFKIALATFTFSSAWPVIGHGIFQKHAPPNSYLVQVIFIESFCIFLEVLHKLFNYEPYLGFYTNVDKKAEAILKQCQINKPKKID